MRETNGKNLVDLFIKKLADRENKALLYECKKGIFKSKEDIQEVVSKANTLGKIEASENYDLNSAIATLGIDNCCTYFHDMCNMWNQYKYDKKYNSKNAVDNALQKRTSVKVTEKENFLKLNINPKEIENIIKENYKENYKENLAKNKEYNEEISQIEIFYNLAGVLLERLIGMNSYKKTIDKNSDLYKLSNTLIMDSAKRNEQNNIDKERKRLVSLLKEGLDNALESSNKVEDMGYEK